MKKILFLATIIFTLFACKSSKSYLERSNEDKALQDAVKKLNKNSTDEKALEAVPVLYDNIQRMHLEKIKSYMASKELSRWDKVISEYESLQKAYEAIVNSPAAFKLVNAKSYSAEIFDTKQNAAEDYYSYGNIFLDKPGRDNAKKAYGYFKKSEKYVPGYKDAYSKMNEAYEDAIVNVVINPVEDNSFFFNSGWGNSGYNYSNEYFQQTLVRELSGNTNNNSRYPAKFYTDWEARRENIKPDWVVDLRLRNLDLPQPTRYTYTRNASAQIEEGRDTAGRAIYRTVHATLNISKLSFTARGTMEVNIKDLGTQKNISYNSYQDEYRWEDERATYNGDSRALNSSDWNLINNNGNNTPRKEEILNELYRKIYPRVKNSISYAVDW